MDAFLRPRTWSFIWAGKGRLFFAGWSATACLDGYVVAKHIADGEGSVEYCDTFPENTKEACLNLL